MNHALKLARLLREMIDDKILPLLGLHHKKIQMLEAEIEVLKELDEMNLSLLVRYIADHDPKNLDAFLSYQDEYLACVAISKFFGHLGSL